MFAVEDSSMAFVRFFFVWFNSKFRTIAIEEQRARHIGIITYNGSSMHGGAFGLKIT